MGLDKWGPWRARTPRIEVEIRDCWVGLYWDNKIEGVVGYGYTQEVDIYVCIIPVFPIHLHFERDEIDWDNTDIDEPEWTKYRS